MQCIHPAGVEADIYHVLCIIRYDAGDLSAFNECITSQSADDQKHIEMCQPAPLSICKITCELHRKLAITTQAACRGGRAAVGHHFIGRSSKYLHVQQQVALAQVLKHRCVE